MVNFEKLRPRRGQLVTEWLEQVIRWGKTLPVIIGPNVMVTQTPLGMKVRLRTSSPISTPFEVSLTGLSANVATGSVEDQVPWIDPGDDRALVRLDGSRLAVDAPLARASLDLSEAEPGEDLTSAIVLRVILNTDGTFPDSDVFQEGLQVVHVSDYSPAEKKRLLEEERTAIHVLAKLYWTTDRQRIRRLGQVTHHNLQASFDDEGRVFFSAT